MHLAARDDDLCTLAACTVHVFAGQRLSAPSVRAGGVVNAVARAGGASVRPDVG